MEDLTFFKNQLTPHLVMKKERNSCNGWSTIMEFSRVFQGISENVFENNDY